MKKILAILFLVLTLPLAVLADSYTSLWKQVEKAQENDHPQTAQQLLLQILSKAQQEKEYGHLLKAQLMYIQAVSVVTPDSMMPELRRFEARVQKAEKGSDKALAAVYDCVLGKMYADNSFFDPYTASLNDSDSDEDSMTPAERAQKYDELSKMYLDRAMKNMDVLAKTKSSGYEPIVVPGNDDYRYFDSDLLHVIGFETGQYKKLSDYYLKKGNRPAACVAAFYQTQKDRFEDLREVRKSKYLATIDSLCYAYRDIPESGIFAVEHYNFLEGATDASAEEKIEYIDYAMRTWPTWVEINKLKNARMLLTLPSFHASIADVRRTTQQTTLVDITALTNLHSITLNVVKINMTGDQKFDPNNDKDYATLKHLREKTPVFSKTLTYVGLPEYKEIRDSILIPGLPLGVYLVEMTTDNNGIRAERALLYVSDLKLVKMPLPENNQRWVVLNAITGKPVSNAVVRLKTRRNGKNEEFMAMSDSKGEVCFEFDNKSYYNTYTIVTTENDKASHWEYTNVNLYNTEFSYDEAAYNNSCQIYTDRAIYRPGQTLKVSAVLYASNPSMNMAKVLAGRKGIFQLISTNGKKLEEKEVDFDEWGYANTGFQLPDNGLTGRYRVELRYTNDDGKMQRMGSKYFSVEQYKRPTFEVKFDEYTDTYQVGDTIVVSGRALSYAGVSVQGAKVQIQACSQQSYFWRYGTQNGEAIILDTISVTTDDDGRFLKRIPMVLPARGRNNHSPRYMTIRVLAQVTDLAGESHSAELSLPLSDKATLLTCSLPDKFVRESVSEIQFNYLNNAGNPVAGSVIYMIDGGDEYTATANEKVAFPASALTSGRHTLYAYNETDSLKQDFIVFALDDKRPPVDTLMWNYQSDRQFKDDLTPVHLQIGTSAKDQYVIYTIVSSTGEVLENGEMTLSDENLNRDFCYNHDWGQGIAMRYVWIRDGKVYSFDSNISRPEPDKTLTLEWKTFRNKLLPGQQEEWTLSVRNADGTPAKAHVIATMYDKSLNDITSSPYTWNRLSIVSGFQLPYFYSYNVNSEDRVNLFGEDKYNPVNVKDLNFSHIELPIYQQSTQQVVMMYAAPQTRRVMKTAAATGSNDGMAVEAMEAKVYDVVVPEASDGVRIRGNASSSAVEITKEAPTPQVRENLDETAFFMPDLVTDESGNVALRFTLPESITTWRVMGLATDKNMNNGVIQDEVVAQKTVMIQPNQPRFLREGDKAVISARIINNSETVKSGTTYVDFLDPETEKSVYITQQKFSVEAGKTLSADFSVPGNLATGLYIMKVVAQGKGFSDGEQHYVAVLPAKELITTTRAFTQTKAGTTTIDLTKLFGKNSSGEKLTVEYTNNPAWLMVQALPVMADPCQKDAVSLTAALYANSIGRSILQQNQDLKTVMEKWQDDDAETSAMKSALSRNEELKMMVLNETPWLRNSDREECQKAQIMEFFNDSLSVARQTAVMSQLKKLQNSDGSFSWWPGMPASPTVSMSVGKMLARLNRMVRTDDGSLEVCNKVMRYLDDVISKEVKELKKLEKKGVKKLMPSELAIEYLYTQSILGGKLSKETRENSKYLLSLIKDHSADLTIYGKAHMAVVFAITPAGADEKEAQKLLESVRQYTVATDEMGRYFDSKNAYYSWCDYRIPSEVAAIEALQILEPDNKDMVSQMQQWLLQEKRTQMWNTSINSTDAVYAFLNGRTSTELTSPVQQTRLTVDGKTVGTKVPTAGLGYVKTQVEGRHQSFSAEKMSDNISWGAVYAQSWQNAGDVEKDGEGISVKRELLVTDGKGGWNHVKGSLKVGDKVKVRITIKTSRDLDFVQVSDKRAACLEPLGQLSGYRGGCYIAPQDNQTCYYFYQLRKGTLQIETEYFVDREGTYTSGTCTAQCAYAPEYSARVGGIELKIEN